MPAVRLDQLNDERQPYPDSVAVRGVAGLEDGLALVFGDTRAVVFDVESVRERPDADRQPAVAVLRRVSVVLARARGAVFCRVLKQVLEQVPQVNRVRGHRPLGFDDEVCALDRQVGPRLGRDRVQRNRLAVGRTASSARGHEDDLYHLLDAFERGLHFPERGVVALGDSFEVYLGDGERVLEFVGDHPGERVLSVVLAFEGSVVPLDRSCVRDGARASFTPTPNPAAIPNAVPRVNDHRG
ncbi:hypothetical protein NGM07_10920 [Halorussus vallis]|nr:hypothetical protein [Halorussus vallis]USZ73969.1 hypothetical protein NGM07_10920 [Halorussus vallis]